MIRVTLCSIAFCVTGTLAFGQNQSIAVISNAPVSKTQQDPIRGIDTGPMRSHEIPLPPPSATQKGGEDVDKGAGAAITVTSSLAIVLGLFGGLVWITRKTGQAKGQSLPKDVFNVLGTSQIDSRHQTALVQCGNRVLLLSLTQSEAKTLCEFTDPSEVNRLVGQINGTSKKAFADALSDADRDHSARGFVEEPTKTRRSLFSHDV